MFVILDSNQIISDFRLESQRFKDLSNYLKSTGGSLIVPDIVIEEVVKNYKERFKAGFEQLTTLKEKTFDSLLGFDIFNLTLVAADKIKATAEYRDYLLNKLNEANYTELKHDPFDRDDFINRALRKSKPLNNSKGSGLADLIVWLSVRDCLKQHGETVFISNNSSDFSEKDAETKLHKQFVKEAQTFANTLHFYLDIQSFLENHFDKPEGIDEKFLMKLSTYKNVLEEVKTDVLELAPRMHAKMKGVEVSDSLKKREAETPQLDSFYIYETDKGKYSAVLRFQINLKYNLNYDNQMHFLGFSNLNLPSAATAYPFGESRIEAKISADAHCTLEQNILSFITILDVRIVDIREEQEQLRNFLSVPGVFHSGSSFISGSAPSLFSWEDSLIMKSLDVEENDKKETK